MSETAADRVSDEPITIDVWVPHPTKPGMLARDHTRPIGEIIADLNTRLAVDGLTPDEYGFKVSNRLETNPWPRYRWIACYAVTGGSEGHYIHVDVIQDEGRRIALALAKTFLGWERACAIAAAAGKHLGA